MSNEEDLYQDPPTGLKNRTDYDFPAGWSEFSQKEKHRWFVRERVFRQAIRQDTSFGRRYRAQIDEPRGVPLHEAWRRAGRGGYKLGDDD